MIVIPPISLGDSSTFTRDTTATYVDLDGTIKISTSNVLRFQNHAAVLEPAGYNYLQDSENLTGWTFNGSYLVGSELASPLASSASACTIGIEGGTSYSKVVPVVAAIGNAITLSIFIKLSTPTYLGLFSSSVPGTIGAVSVEPLASGWFRHSQTCILTSAISSIEIIIRGAPNTEGEYTIWGAQVEKSTRATSYIRSLGTPGTRAADVLTKGIWSSIAEPDTGEAVWIPATAYTTPTKVLRMETHSIYESLSTTATVDSTLPEVSINTVPPKWRLVGASNKFAMFDLLRNTKTTATDKLSVVLTPTQRINTLVLANMENVAYIRVYLHYSGVTSVLLDSSNTFIDDQGGTGYYSSKIIRDIQPFNNQSITIELTGTGSIGCGACVLGLEETLGFIQRGATSDNTSFSSVNRDLYGNTSFVPRRSIPNLRLNSLVMENTVSRVARVRGNLSAVPAVWICSTDEQDAYYDTLLIVGFYKTFRITLNPIAASVELELEEI